MNNGIGELELLGARLAFNDSEKKEHYSDYLALAIEKIPMVSLWDECFRLAKGLFYSCRIPDCINGVDWKSINLEYERIDAYQKNSTSKRLHANQDTLLMRVKQKRKVILKMIMSFCYYLFSNGFQTSLSRALMKKKLKRS